MKVFRKRNRESGQALVLVLLSLAVVLTLVLYILSRSVTDILVSSKNEETTRAFSAAEAGVEQALVIGTGGDNPNIGNSSGYVSDVAEFAKGSTDFNYPIELASGDSFTTWFVSHDKNNNDKTVCDGTPEHPCFTGDMFKICWGKAGTDGSLGTAPAIEVSIFYEAIPGSLPTIKIARIAVDPNASRIGSNAFVSPDAGTCQIAGVTYQFQKTIQNSTLGIPASSYGVENGLQFARVRMFYNSDTTHPIGVSTNFAGSTTLPSQGDDITSTGTSGQSTRKISVFQGWPEPPSVFDFAIYSSTGITK